MRHCNCIDCRERDLCSLRGKLTGEDCQSLAPWERELYGEQDESEPYVDLYVTNGSGREMVFRSVRGICVERIKHAPPIKDTELTLTFEGVSGITVVLDPIFWRSEATDQ